MKALDIEHTKYFLKLEHTKASTKHICCIEKDNGTQLNSPDKILAEEKHFYKSLYSKNMVLTKHYIKEANGYFFNKLPLHKENRVKRKK